VLKAHQALLVGWQDRYNIQGGEKEKSSNDFDGSSFSADDATLQNNMIADMPVNPSELKDVHEDADRAFVSKFDPSSDDIDKLLLELITKQKPTTTSGI